MKNETRPTPGPWTILEDGSGEPDSLKRDSNGDVYQEKCRIHSLTAKHSVAHIYLGAGKAIPKSDGRPGGMQEYRPTPAAIEQQGANAHLIAAAPELLDALEEVLCAAYAEGYILPTWIDDAARAALAKARGEEVQP
jgi:hypothetical protein